MARKRAPEHDYICIRCGCPCDPGGTKHIGGGQGMRACKQKPHAMLRSEWEAEVEAVVAGLRAHRRGRGSAPAPPGLSQLSSTSTRSTWTDS